MLTDEQRKRITKNIGKRVQVRVQLAAEQEKTRNRGKVKILIFGARRGYTVLQNAQQEIDDEYRALVGEPGIHVGTYDPDVSLDMIDEDIKATVMEYMEWGK